HTDEPSALLDDGHALEILLLENVEGGVELEASVEREVRGLRDLAKHHAARVEPLRHDLAHERLARHDAEQPPVVLRDEDRPHLAVVRKAAARLLRARAGRKRRRLGHHRVAYRLGAHRAHSHGKMPRASSAAATSRIAATIAAWRRVIPLSSETEYTRWRASPIMSDSLSRISSRSQKSRPRSCTHSKYETVTPPAFARMSGTTGIPRSPRISSASIVVGPFAPSTTSVACTRPAFAHVSWPSRAASTRTSHGSSRSCSLVIRSQRS